MSKRWWQTELATEEDPISLEPLRKLRYPPFRLRADPDLPHWVSADWFDGKVLASYLVSTGQFNHPISRRALTRDECAALDSYLSEHQLGEAHVELVFRHVKRSVDSATASSATSHVARLRAGAATVLGSLFGGTEPTSTRAASSLSAASRDGNLTIVDDDMRPSHQPVAAAELEAAVEEDPFPELPVASAVAIAERPVGAALAGVWQDSVRTRTTAAAGGLPTAAPPPPPEMSQEERERQGRARLERERVEWARALRQAEAAAEAERARELEAQRRASWEAQRERNEWAVAEAMAVRAAAAAASAAAEAAADAERRAREEAAAAAAALPRALHDAAAACSAALVTLLLERGADPTVRHVAYAGALAYDVAADGPTRDAFRAFSGRRPTDWDWAAAHVPSGLTEAEEAEHEAEKRKEAKERKKKKEAERKGRRKEAEAKRGAAADALRAATSGDDAEALSAALDEAKLCLPEAVAGGTTVEDEVLMPAILAAEARLKVLTDPSWVQAKQRELRAAEAEKRLGALTPAQRAFLLKADKARASRAGAE